MSVKRLVRLLGDIFWSSMIVLALLIVAFFVLRVVSRTRVPVAPGVATGLASAATPQG